MLAFLTGFGFGAAAGWFAFVRREWLFMLVLLNGGAAMTAFFISVVLPSSSAAGSMDMNLWQFTLFAADRMMGDFISSALVWWIFGFLIAHIITLVAYKGFEPEPEPVIEETRDDRRRRIQLEMNYQNRYLD